MLEQSGATETSEFSLVLMKMICYNGRLISAWNIYFIFFSTWISATKITVLEEWG